MGIDELLSDFRFCREETVREELESLLQCDEIWLHSFRSMGLLSHRVVHVNVMQFLSNRYSGPGWSFEAPFPAWASRHEN